MRDHRGNVRVLLLLISIRQSFELNGEQLEYYNRDIRKFIPKTEWMQKVDAADPFYWDRNARRERELVCHATEFFSKAVMMTDNYCKDGEEVEEDVEVRETLPNQDGSFQKRIILRVSPEDLQKNKYTTVTQHRNLEEDLREEPRVFTKGEGWIGLTYIIIRVVVLLLVRVLINVGILMWKKKNSGFRAFLTSEPDGEPMGSHGSSNKCPA